MSGCRISAGELQDRYTLKHTLFDFYMDMWSTIISHFPNKGSSWKTCKLSYLKRELRGHIKEGDWIDVANFAFFLHQREIDHANALYEKLRKEKEKQQT